MLKLNKILVPFRVVLLVFFSVFLLVLFSEVCLAQNKLELFVGPSVFDISLEKGETYNGRILLWNKNDFTLTVNSQLTNFSAKDELGKINYEKREGTKWFSTEELKFTLKPEERKIVKFQIKIPEDTPRGGYYVSWIFTPQPRQKETNTKLIPRVSSLFLISVGQKGKANFKIIETDIPSGARYSLLEKIFKKEIILNNASFPFTFRVKNNDIYHVRPQGTLEVFKGDKSIGKADIKETTILPGKIRRISADFKPSSGLLSNFYFGNYKAILKLRASGVTRKVEKEIFILPWKEILIIKISLILILLYFIIIKQKKRMKKKTAKSKSRTNSRTKKSESKRTLTSKSKLR